MKRVLTAAQALRSAFSLRRRQPAAPHRGNCFVGFFGLNRSLQWTYDSIHTHILDELENFGYRTFRVAHFNCPEVINNPRSQEINVPLPKMDGVNKLRLEVCRLERQSNDNLGDLLSVVLNVPLMWEADPSGLTRTYALHQLYSLRRLGQILDAVETEFDLYCLLRADLMYIDPMPVAAISRLIRYDGLDIVTASWHKFSGFNDRFAFCSRRGADFYLNRIDWVRPFCNEMKQFHPENLLRFSALRSGMKYGFTPMRAKRVRATGMVKDEDFAADLPDPELQPQ